MTGTTTKNQWLRKEKSNLFYHYFCVGHSVKIMSINTRLKILRRTAGLTQEELGKKLTKNGYSKQFISNVELGRYNPGLEMIKAWSSACGYETAITFTKVI